MKDTRFKIGNDVKWSSHGGHVMKHKRGEIVGQVAVGTIPSVEKFPGLRVGETPRTEMSYVVRQKKTGKHYWPWTSALRKV